MWNGLWIVWVEEKKGKELKIINIRVRYWEECLELRIELIEITLRLQLTLSMILQKWKSDLRSRDDS